MEYSVYLLKCNHVGDASVVLMEYQYEDGRETYVAMILSNKLEILKREESSSYDNACGCYKCFQMDLALNW